jgi:tetratricopeptide (TPR) repeat protein
MDQLVALQEIFESFANGKGNLHSLSSKSVEGPCADLIGQLLEGSKNGEVSAEICRRLADSLDDVYEIKRLGDVCRHAGHLEIALKCYNKALYSGQENGVGPVIMNNLGQVYAGLGDIGQAVAHYQKAAEGFESAKDKSGLAHVLGNMGSAYRCGQDWQRAVEHCFKSLKTFQELNDGFGVAQMTGSLGRIYADMGERDLAGLYYEKSLKDFEALGDKRSVAWVLERLGRIKAESQSWNESERYLERSLSIFEDLGQPRSAGVVMFNMGKMYLEMGETQKALNVLERSLNKLGKGIQPVYQNAVSCVAATYSQLARQHLREAYLGMGEKSPDEMTKLASQYYNKAADRYTELYSLPKANLSDVKIAAMVARALSYIARLYSEAKDEEAVTLIERAISSTEGAMARAGEGDKPTIEAMQKVLVGMEKVWSAGLDWNEPWKAAREIEEGCQSLLGGAQLLSASSQTTEALKSLSGSLTNLSSALDDVRCRRDPSEAVKAASANLRLACNSFKAVTTEVSEESASRVESASQLLEKLGAISFNPNSEMLSYEALRSVLMEIGWSLVGHAFVDVDKTSTVLTWDDSVRLIYPSKQSASSRASSPTEIPTQPGAKAVKDIIDADVVAKTADPKSWLVPLSPKMICTPTAAEARQGWKAKSGFKLGPSGASTKKRFKPWDVPITSEEIRFDIDTYDFRDDISDPDDFREDFSFAREPGLKEVLSDKLASFNLPALVKDLSNSMEPRGIAAVKVAAVVVVVLTAIDVILYLI